MKYPKLVRYLKPREPLEEGETLTPHKADCHHAAYQVGLAVRSISTAANRDKGEQDA